MESLSFWFNDSIFVLPDTKFPICGINTYNPTECKVTGTGSKTFASGLLQVMLSGTILVSVHWFLTCEFWLLETQCRKVDPDSKHIQPSEEPQSCKLLSPILYYDVSPRDHSTFLSFQLLLNDEENGKIVNSMSVSHCLTSLVVKCFSLSEAVLCGIPWWWMKHSVIPQVIVLAKVLHAVRANPYPE